MNASPWTATGTRPPLTTPGTTGPRWLSATSTAWTCASTRSATWPWGKACMNTTGACAKRLQPSGLRHAVPKGRRVLLIYDQAGIGFAY